MHESVATMWQRYLATLDRRPDDEEPRPVECLFCDNEADANELARLVVLGRKRATAPSVWELEVLGEPLPRIGDLQVVTNWDGVAQCVIRTNAVEVVPFEAVTAEFAAVEGEGDGSLEHWRRVHREYYTRVLKGTEHAFDPRMPIVCERFEVVFPAGSRGAPTASRI